ncbi:MAG: carbon storage regulator CsrA [Desulfobacterales bacterium]
MLVLTRKAGEGLLIGDNIRVAVLESQDGKVRLGIEAPAEYRIYRQEVYERICRENREASQWNAVDLDALDSLIRGRGEQT